MRRSCIRDRKFVAFALMWALGLLFSCASEVPRNPPLEGFNLAGSDAKAMEIADAVMEQMGGRKNWDQTRYLTWRFFGRRMHVWDKQTGNIRVEQGDRVTLMNIHTKQGRVWEQGTEVVDPDTLVNRLDQGYRAWVNDSYWVFMPYKLKDTGVTLRYRGEATTEDGRLADVLVLTFEDTGVTPQNKYEVYVDKERRMVEQWSFFSEASDEEPRFISPWKNWQKYGEILLSDDRGQRKHNDIAVFDNLPAVVFESPEPVEMMSLKR